MKKFFSILGWIGLTIVLVSVSMGASYLLPYPFSKINMLYAAILLLIVARPRGGIVWMSCLAHLFLELTAATPFGVMVMSGTLSTLVGFWAYQYIFSNRSWYALLAMSMVTLTLYRGLYVLFFVIAQLVGSSEGISLRGIMVTTGWEILFTTAFIGVLYMAVYYRKDKRVSRIHWYGT